jgi:glycosyltransferase involved in cell wall biosynthesis
LKKTFATGLIRQFALKPFVKGFGLPVLEAMACGAPVITTNATSLPEVVGAAALIVSPDDMEALAQDLAMLAGDEAMRQNLVQKGFSRRTEFS